MTCFFPCGGAVLKTEGTSAQPTAVAPPPARQLGAAGEPPMPAPSGRGAAAAPGQVRLGGEPPPGRGARPRGAGAAGKRRSGEGAAGLPGESLLQAAVPACVRGGAAGTAAPLGASPSPWPPPALPPLGGRPRAPARRRGGGDGGAAATLSPRRGVCVPLPLPASVRVPVCMRGHRGSSAGRRAEVWGQRPALLAGGRAGGGGAGTAGRWGTGTAGYRGGGCRSGGCRGSGVQRQRGARAGVPGQGVPGQGVPGQGVPGQEVPG